MKGGSLKKLAGRIGDIVRRMRHGIVISNRAYERVAELAGKSENDLRRLSDDELKHRAVEAAAVCSKSHSHKDHAKLLAVAREVADRTVGLRPYDVQLIAAQALADGKCVEMATGEGKTLAAGLAACLCAGRFSSIHILTFNDYLATRDAQWMAPLLSFFGLTVGAVHEGMSTSSRRAAYACDVTYVTAKEAGFDFLRDQGCDEIEQRVQRGHHFAIVDEADSILIDEARIPLVLAADDEHDTTDLQRFAHLVRELHPGRDYQVLSNGRNSSFTDFGISQLEARLNCGELYSETNAEILSRLNLALHAELLLHKDVDYIVRENTVELIDEFTGRVAANRRWPGGIQAALEAKENVPVRPQGVILNSITMQYFLELYDQLAGMSGTAQESTGELGDFYNLQVVIVPPNVPCIRVDQPDRIFRSRAAKFDALAAEIVSQHKHGRPVLVGTASVGESTFLAARLAQEGIDCRILNASNDHEEAAIIADAGAPGAVTISTNMAGRGTDIKLGGHDERDRESVVALGGLYVIGTNRHESRRIDNQLRGRAGRQGDPGESRFFISLEDDLLQRYSLVRTIAASAFTNHNSEADGNNDTAKQIAHLQRVIEGESLASAVCCGNIRSYWNVSGVRCMRIANKCWLPMILWDLFAKQTPNFISRLSTNGEPT